MNASELSLRGISPYEGNFKHQSIIPDHIFRDEEEAIFCLYEELFDSMDEIDNKRIYNALRYLLWSKGLMAYYEHLDELSADEICVKHVYQAEKEKEEEINYFKNKLTELLEE